MFAIKNKEDTKDLEELVGLQTKVKQIRLVEKLGERGYQFDLNEIFEPITQTVTDTSQELLDEIKYNTKAIENLDESIKTLKL